MPDEIHLSPFERRHIGPHGAFIFRIDRAHEAEAIRRVLQRRLAEISVEFGAAASVRLARAA